MRDLQVKFNSIQMPLSWPTSNTTNRCCLSSLYYALRTPNKFDSAKTIETRISSSLTGAILDRIKFSNEMMIDEARTFGDQHLHYERENGIKLVPLISRIISILIQS